MTVRERTQEIERMTLAPWATRSEDSRGRAAPEEECPLRTCFQRDRDRVIHSKASVGSSRKRRCSSRRRATITARA